MHPLLKGALVGAGVAALVTLLVHGSAVAFGRTGESFISFLLIFPWLAVVLPGKAVAHLIGWRWQTAAVYEITIANVAFMMCINGLIGSFFGVIVADLRRCR
jgi:hypothetical protein